MRSLLRPKVCQLVNQIRPSGIASCGSGCPGVMNSMCFWLQGVPFQSWETALLPYLLVPDKNELLLFLCQKQVHVTATYSCSCQEEKVAKSIVRQVAPKQTKPPCWFALRKVSQFCMRAWGVLDLWTWGLEVHPHAQPALGPDENCKLRGLAWWVIVQFVCCTVAQFLVNHQLWESLKPNSDEQCHPLKELNVSKFCLGKPWAPSPVLWMLVSASK